MLFDQGVNKIVNNHLEIRHQFQSSMPCPNDPHIGHKLEETMPSSKIQQTKMLVTCQRFGDLFLFGLVWQYSKNQNQYDKGIGLKSWLLTCISNITLSLH